MAIIGYKCFRIDPSVPLGYIGLSSVQRSWLQLALNEDVDFEPFQLTGSDKNSFSALLDIEVLVIILIINSFCFQVDFMKRGQACPYVFDSDHLAKVFKNNFNGQILSKGQVGNINVA